MTALYYTYWSIYFSLLNACLRSCFLIYLLGQHMTSHCCHKKLDNTEELEKNDSHYGYYSERIKDDEGKPNSSCYSATAALACLISVTTSIKRRMHLFIFIAVNILEYEPRASPTFQTRIGHLCSFWIIMPLEFVIFREHEPIYSIVFYEAQKLMYLVWIYLFQRYSWEGGIEYVPVYGKYLNWSIPAKTLLTIAGSVALELSIETLFQLARICTKYAMQLCIKTEQI
ncbi:MAG: hypothetical protein MHMPM18_000060 [Marteilia pararefringens]